MDTIKLNDILKINDLDNVKIQFIFSNDKAKKPLDKVERYKYYNNSELEKHLHIWFGWNAGGNAPFKQNQIGIALLDLSNNNTFLLVAVRKVLNQGVKDLTDNFYHYETENIEQYSKYIGRVIVKCHSKNLRNICQNASTLIDKLDVTEILSNNFRECSHKFPGYDNVNVSWSELARVIEKDTWKTALQNQKGVYLITDISNGKMYVGSASGEYMILGRWQSYIKTGNGGNVGLKKLSFEYIKENFRYSILDVFKSTIDDQTIIDRENWWKNVLQSREFGYNEN